MGVISWDEAVDIGLGRGRLAREAAASLARVDAAMRSAFGRAADINEAWRSPEQANANYARYRAYLRDPRNNPWAPIALPAEESIHCRGYAVDTDDTSDAQMRIWNDHGWFWTVYRNGVLVERWHLEYFRDRDNHRNDPTPEDTMNGQQEAKIDARFNDLVTRIENVAGFIFGGGISTRDPEFQGGAGSLYQRLRNVEAHLYAGGPDASKLDYLAAPGTIYHLLKRRVKRGRGARPTQLPEDGSSVLIEQIQDTADTNTLLRALTVQVEALTAAVAKLSPEAPTPDAGSDAANNG